MIDADDAATATRRADAMRWIAGLHDELTGFFERLDQGATFREDQWDRPGGGGGVARVLTDGRTFEKAGVNRSAVAGELPREAVERLGDHAAAAGATQFFATGVSLVVHPRSPKVPTVHLNVRYFELTDGDGRMTDCWYGGGADLTPFYPHHDDARTFHRALKAMADRHHPALYATHKTRCDAYFVNAHRNNEARGVGGIFFDHLRTIDPADDAHARDSVERDVEQPDDVVRAYVTDVARVLPAAYEPIVARRRDEPYGDGERAFQLARRGRYVEFNLVHDRGTTFGLHTNARVESVLMSLPPLAAWPYAPDYASGTFEARLIEMLRPQEWAGEG